MPRVIRIRLRLLVALLLATAVWATDARPLAADCEVTGLDGLLRDCTFTEEYGQCALNAYDSYYQCIRNIDANYERGSIWYGFEATRCELGLYADLTACLPTTLVRNILS